MSGLEGAIYSDIRSLKTAIDQLAGQNLLTAVNTTGTATGGTTTNVDIQPAAGQTWEIFVIAHLEAASTKNAYIEAAMYNGTVLHGGVSDQVMSTANYGLGIGVFGKFKITNTNYLRLRFGLSAGADETYRYSYHGVRLA